MRSLVAFILIMAVLTVTVSCASGGARRIDPTERVVTADQIDIQDWEEVASELLNSMLSRDAIQRHDDASPIIAVSRIENRTSERINTEHLTDYILTELNRSGMARASLIEGIGGPEDPMIAEQRRAEQFLEGGDAPIREYSYTLSGRIIEERRRVGGHHQSTFVFTLRLGDPRTGAAEWQEQRTIDKAGRRARIGM